MTITLIVVNVLIFLFLQPAALQGGDAADNGSRTEQRQVDEYSYRWGVVPCEIHHQKPVTAKLRCTGERAPRFVDNTGKVVLLSLLTSMFIHGGILHLAGNMLF